MILTSIGVVFPSILQKYATDLTVSVISVTVGAVVSLIGSFVLIYATKPKLVVKGIIYRC